MCSSGDIFQAKVGKLLVGTEVFKENTADISKFILSVKGSYCLWKYKLSVLHVAI